jgi:hypothetical protein
MTVNGYKLFKSSGKAGGLPILITSRRYFPLEQANAFLWSTDLPLKNGKFSRPLRNADDARVRADPVTLDDILCLE